MPDRFAHDLAARYGAGVAEGRGLHFFEVPACGGTVEACYDPYNRRLKLFDLSLLQARESPVVRTIFSDASPNELYDKVLIYARPAEDFDALGLVHEATIRGYFANGDDARLWALYLDPERAVEQNKEQNDRAYAIAVAKKPVEPRLPAEYTSAVATVGHAAEIAALMTGTFSDYPTPITMETIRKNIETRFSHFRMVRDPRGDLVACASAEIQTSCRNAEMTDCATRPDQRGQGLMSWLLRALEGDLQTALGITDVYTLARAGEIGMNCSFAKLGYVYTGRLVNNCRMPDGWESMSVWCRSAQRPRPS